MRTEKRLKRSEQEKKKKKTLVCELCQWFRPSVCHDVFLYYRAQCTLCTVNCTGCGIQEPMPNSLYFLWFMWAYQLVHDFVLAQVKVNYKKSTVIAYIRICRVRNTGCVTVTGWRNCWIYATCFLVFAYKLKILSHRSTNVILFVYFPLTPPPLVSLPLYPPLFLFLSASLYYYYAQCTRSGSHIQSHLYSISNWIRRWQRWRMRYAYE